MFRVQGVRISFALGLSVQSLGYNPRIYGESYGKEHGKCNGDWGYMGAPRLDLEHLAWPNIGLSSAALPAVSINAKCTGN